MNCVTKIRNNCELIFIFAAESAKWQGNESILGCRLSALSPVGPFLCGVARVGAASLFVRLEECSPRRGPLVLPLVVLRCFGPPRHASLAPRAPRRKATKASPALSHPCRTRQTMHHLAPDNASLCLSHHCRTSATIPQLGLHCPRTGEMQRTVAW